MGKVKKGDYIQMIASMAGGDFSYAPDQVLEVGKHIDVDLANKLLGPPEEPRARAIDKETGKRLVATPEVTADATEVPQRSQAQERGAGAPNDPTGHEGTPGPIGAEDGEPDPARPGQEDDQPPREGETGDDHPEGETRAGGDQAAEGETDGEPDPDQLEDETDQDGESEEEDVKEEERSQATDEAEQATSTAAEKRETATQKRKRTRVKPPEEPKDEDEQTS